MSIIDEVQALKRASQVQEGQIAKLEEQVNGERGISAAINANTQEIRSFRKIGYWLIGLIVAASIGFGFGVLVLIPPG